MLIPGLPIPEEENRALLMALMPTPEKLLQQYTEFLTTCFTNPTRLPTAILSAILPAAIGATLLGTVRENGGVPRIFISSGWYTKEQGQQLFAQLPAAHGMAAQQRSHKGNGQEALPHVAPAARKTANRKKGGGARARA